MAESRCSGDRQCGGGSASDARHCSAGPGVGTMTAMEGPAVRDKVGDDSGMAFRVDPHTVTPLSYTP